MSNSTSFNATLAGVYLALEPRSMVSTAQPQIEAELAGLVGDRHYGFTRLSNGRWPWYPRGTEIRNDRQASIVSLEELAEVAAALGVPEIRPEWLGANLLTQGLPKLTQLPPNTRLFFPSGAALVVIAENFPCSDPARIIAEQTGVAEAARLFPKLGWHKRGLVAVIEHAGRLCPGDVVNVELP